MVDSCVTCDCDTTKELDYKWQLERSFVAGRACCCYYYAPVGLPLEAFITVLYNNNEAAAAAIATTLQTTIMTKKTTGRL